MFRNSCGITPQASSYPLALVFSCPSIVNFFCLCLFSTPSLKALYSPSYSPYRAVNHSFRAPPLPSLHADPSAPVIWSLGWSCDARGCQCPYVMCFHPQGCLRSGVRASGSYQERTGKSGSSGMRHHTRGYVSNFLVRRASC